MTTDRWLDPRLQGAPPELAAAVRGLLEPDAGEPASSEAQAEVPDRLAAAAIRGFGAVLQPADPSPRSHEVALRLLAADALLTYAFEAAADLDLDIDGLAERIGPGGTFGTLLVAAVEEGCP